MQIQVITQLPNEIDLLESESLSEGFKFITKLRLEFESGKNRFDRPGECLVIIKRKNELVGICGLNIDPFTDRSGVGRVRNLYIFKKHRKTGAGRHVIKYILDQGSKTFECVRLRTFSQVASAFYVKLGFKLDRDEFSTHMWIY